MSAPVPEFLPPHAPGDAELVTRVYEAYEALPPEVQEAAAHPHTHERVGRARYGSSQARQVRRRLEALACPACDVGDLVLAGRLPECECASCEAVFDVDANLNLEDQPDGESRAWRVVSLTLAPRG